MTLRLDPIQLATNSADREARLVFSFEMLVAVLVCLSADHEGDEGKWFLEAGFGPIGDRFAPLFDTLDAAQSWIAEQIANSGSF